ncbi:alpha/beta hydrolase [Brevibacillus daliensis]|uniref:alpha/beta hydrolase n=1 Tax=Brevibacillus daliensis TaxID=2892995 RepID=UPI001E4C4C0A|nr:alpha/beta fold hydrolase [Brevibacillus daliensis]
MPSLGFLVLHGFAGSIADVSPLIQFLRNRGHLVVAPTLAGHDGDRLHLQQSSREQWVQTAEAFYQQLAEQVDTIVVIGFSMGGLLSFHLAATRQVDLLFTLCTPYHYWDARQAFLYMKDDFISSSKKYWNSLVRIPFSSMLHFRRLLSETKPILPQITCPYYIIQGLRDDTVKATSADKLRQHVSSKHVEVKYFNHSGHVILLGPETEQVIHYIDEMLMRQFPDSYGNTTVLF